MKKNLVSYVFFLTAIIDIVVSINNINGNKIFLGVTYLFLAITFIILGLRYRKKENK